MPENIADYMFIWNFMNGGVERGTYAWEVYATIDENGDCVVITSTNPISKNPLFESITCTYHLSEGKYQSVNMTVTYSIESLSEQASIDVQSILREQTSILL